METIPLDSLLATMESEVGPVQQAILRAARIELETLSDNLSWAHALISHYAEHHEKKLSPYTFSSDRKSLTEKFIRNDRFRQHLEAQHPWLAARIREESESEMANFNSMMQVDEYTKAKMAELWPHMVIEETPLQAGDLEAPEAPVEEPEPYHGIMPPPASPSSLDNPEGNALHD